MITTKEQERQAIERIRKIVEGLGENSYVGYAMDGVLEVAEWNIEFDEACSLKERLNIAIEEANHERKLSKERLTEIEKLKEDLRVKTEAVDYHLKMIEESEKRGKELNELIDKAYSLASRTFDTANNQMSMLAEQMADAIAAGEDATMYANMYKRRVESAKTAKTLLEMISKWEEYDEE